MNLAAHDVITEGPQSCNVSLLCRIHALQFALSKEFYNQRGGHSLREY
jgi:hypothetical protein